MIGGSSESRDERRMLLSRSDMSPPGVEDKRRRELTLGIGEGAEEKNMVAVWGLSGRGRRGRRREEEGEGEEGEGFLSGRA